MAMRPPPPRPAPARLPELGAAEDRWLVVRVAAVCAIGFALGLLLGALVPY